MNPFAAYQPYSQGNVNRPQGLALMAMLQGRGVYGNPMDAQRQLAARYASLARLLSGRSQ